jgi:predicted transcriptional regulator
MEKTTLYLPDDLKRAIAEVAAARGCSQAELVREALQALVRSQRPP